MSAGTPQAPPLARQPFGVPRGITTWSPPLISEAVPGRAEPFMTVGTVRIRSD